MIWNKEHNVDFGTQNVEWKSEHYSQTGKEGPQKINTVGILYHSKWLNILPVSWIVEMFMSQYGEFLFVTSN